MSTASYSHDRIKGTKLISSLNWIPLRAHLSLNYISDYSYKGMRGGGGTNVQHHNNNHNRDETLALQRLLGRFAVNLRLK